MHVAQIAPAYLESILMSHPDVREVAVIGEPVGVNGEVPKAFVIPSSPVSEETLVNFVNGKTCVKEGFKVVWGILTYMDESSVVQHFQYI